MPAQILQREMWFGQPSKQGDYFRLRKDKAGREVLAVCELWTHQFGWELQLVLAGDFQRSQVCRTQEAVFETGDAWKAALLEKGWA